MSTFDGDTSAFILPVLSDSNKTSEFGSWALWAVELAEALGRVVNVLLIEELVRALITSEIKHDEVLLDETIDHVGRRVLFEAGRTCFILDEPVLCALLAGQGIALQAFLRVHDHEGANRADEEIVNWLSDRLRRIEIGRYETVYSFLLRLRFEFFNLFLINCEIGGCHDSLFRG